MHNFGHNHSIIYWTSLPKTKQLNIIGWFLCMKLIIAELFGHHFFNHFINCWYRSNFSALQGHWRLENVQMACSNVSGCMFNIQSANVFECFCICDWSFAIYLNWYLAFAPILAKYSTCWSGPQYETREPRRVLAGPT